MTVKITCKQCRVQMDRLSYMSMKSCENANCTCPEVVKLRKQTQEVINRASQSSINVQSVKRNTVPTGYDEDVNQYMMDIPDVMVVDIIVPKTGGQKRRK